MTQIIPNQEIMTNALPDQFLKVYRWASQNTAETRQHSKQGDGQTSSYKYFWPSPASFLLNSLKLSRGQLIALVGLSGVGKSSAQREIARSLDVFLASNTPNEDSSAKAAPIPRAIYFKWPGKFVANISAIGDSLELSEIINRQEEYLLQIIKKANSDPEYDERLYDVVSSLKGKTLDSLKAKLQKAGYSEEAFIKKFVSKREQKEIERELVISTLSNCHSVLIDMRDYGMDDKHAMAGDLSEIQKLWQTILDRISANNVGISRRAKNDLSVSDGDSLARNEGEELEVPNFVFVLQKELAMSDEGMVTHFFLGKATVIEIAPFSPKELVDYYKSEFGGIYPFKDESNLALLARVSRGIFRRFLRYIKLSLEAYIQNSKESTVKQDNVADSPTTTISIDSDLITKTLDSEEIYADWRMDLGRIFSRNPRQAKAASEIVRVLMEAKSPMPQSLIT